MNLHCVGINHRTAPLEVREQLWFSAQEARSLVQSLHERQLPECVLISTCNRTELYYTTRDESSNGSPMWTVLANHKGASGAGGDHFYTIGSLNAVKHLFNVASGIDSMVVGDIQILNQIKEAYAISHELAAMGSVMNRVFDTALRIGKRARTETEISSGAVSVSYAAAELSSKIFSDLSKRSALLIGAGETGSLTAKHLVGRNVGTLLLTNRTRMHAEAIAPDLGGRVVDFESFLGEINHVDIVICSIQAPSYVLSAQDLRQAMKLRGNRPLFLIDLGVPRNIDPEANSIENIFLHDLDALNRFVEKNLRHRTAEVPKVRQIVLDELIQFNRWYGSLEVNPTIEQLRDHVEAIRRAEVEKHLRHFSPGEREELELLTKRIINKILHTPTVNLKTEPESGSGERIRDRIHVVRHLFGLDKRKPE
ncbi:MAG TPA: glutamyl-tRNA reductase [Bacteroidota bacterium]|jgi:glutamyl-tRNA reductase